MSYNKILDNDIHSIKKSITTIIEATKSQYARTFEVIKNHDEQLAIKVIENDRKINDMQNDFTSKALWKIAKQQMVASDLRLCVGSILIAREIERISNYTKLICKYFIKYKPDEKTLDYISKMFDIVIKMLNTISTMIESYDVSNSSTLLNLEAQLNLLFKDLNIEMISLASSSGTDFKMSENLIMATRQLKNLERAGDHIISVEGILHFIKTGKFEDIDFIDKQIHLDPQQS